MKIISFRKKISSLFQFLKEPLLVQKQTIPQQKGLIFRFMGLESLRAWYYQEGFKDIEKKSKFNGAKKS